MEERLCQYILLKSSTTFSFIEEPNGPSFSCGVFVIYRLQKDNSVPKLVYDLRCERRNLNVNVRKMDKYVDC